MKVLLADDHTVTRRGIRQILEDESGYTVVAEAENGREAVRTAQEIEPDIVILDISMPELNGLDAARQILQMNPQVKILILSMHSEKMFVEQALEIGASAYLLKDCAVDEIVTALKHVCEGRSYLSPGITGIVIDRFRRKEEKAGKEKGDCPLTVREREVLQLIAEGKTSKEIAAQLFISIKTVEARRKQIMEKLDLHSIAELTKYAIREGLTTLD